MIRLAKPYLGEEELAEIASVLASGYLSQGPKVAEFEHGLAEHLNVKHAIAVSSGTAALHLSVLALGLGESDEVIVPDFTFPATANVVALAGATPIFCDIDLDTFNLDPEELEPLITPRTKAVVPVHQFGLAADMTAIISVAEKFDLKIIEDAACALGAQYHGQKCGTFGTVSCFSFHPRKIITTGEGGMVLTNDDGIAERIRVLRNHGSVGTDFPMPGLNYRMSDIQAAVGVVQTRRLGQLIEKRQELGRIYTEELSCVSGVTLPAHMDGATHTFQSYVIRLEETLDRDRIKQMLRERGIEAGIGTYALHNLKCYEGSAPKKASHLRRSAVAYRQALALPLFPEMTLQEIKYVSANLRSIVSDSQMLRI